MAHFGCFLAVCAVFERLVAVRRVIKRAYEQDSYPIRLISDTLADVEEPGSDVERPAGVGVGERWWRRTDSNGRTASRADPASTIGAAASTSSDAAASASAAATSSDAPANLKEPSLFGPARRLLGDLRLTRRRTDCSG